MNNKPLVSVIMNCYNSDTYLREAIESVLNQTYTEFELIFWDNRSTDKSAEIVQSYKDKRIKYFYAPIHTTLGEGRNCALSKCLGQYISFLDCDDSWLPTKLATQLSLLQKNPEILFCFGSYIRYFEQSKKKVFIHPCFKKSYSFNDLLRQYDINLQTVLFDIRLLNSMDQFFDDRFSFSEEADFFMRMLYGNHAICLNEPLALYRIHDEQITNRQFERAVDENELILTKLLVLHPEIERIFPKEVQFFRAKTAYYKSKVLMKLDQKKTARSILSVYKFLSLKYFLLYFLSFSTKLWNFADKIKNRS